jgi:phosphoserine phosphatase RsbU/P
MSVTTADPVADPKRLAAVFASELLDTEPENAFDDLTRMAALVVGAPFAFATVVDDARSFWKSRYGIPAGGANQNQVEESFCKYVVRTQSELIVTDASIDERTRDNPSVAAMGVRAWAGFPLLSPGGEVLGSFCIVDTAPREWTPRDLEVIRTLAAAASREVALRAAVMSERVARQSAEALVHTLQQSLLPPALPEVPGLDIAGRFHPAGNGLELVGDFYDVFASRTDRWNVLVGDVCGKGIEAAKVAALARHTVGSSSMRELETPEVLRWLNETLRARSHAPHEFLSAVYGTLKHEGNGWAMCLCCAGHPPPILRRANGHTALIDAGGPLIGVFDDFAIDEVELRLEPGDMLVICTDGIIEARAGRTLFGEDALIALIASADASAGAAMVAQQIEAAALQFSNGIATDDIAVVVIRVPG